MSKSVAACRCVLCATLLAFSFAPLAAQQSPAKGQRSAAADPAGPAERESDAGLIAARVGDDTIDVEEVRRTLQRGLRGRALPDAARPRLEAEALELAINQRLVDRAVRREKLAPSAGQVEAAMDAIRRQALARYATFEAYLEATGQTEASLRRQTAWRWGWRNYLARHVTDDLRQRVFAAQRRDLDGTEIRVSHILLKVDETPGDSALAARIDEAAALRRRIEAGELTFAEAASRYSDGPSKQDGGDLGYIARRGSMDEAFTKAAFALEPNEISPPVVSPFGVHLIQCTEVRPGAREWTDVRQELEPRVIQHLFAETAAAERANCKVEYAGAVSRLDPATGEVVEPE
jgi:parvulin-like peptidyl-prolyl isomerase